MFENSIFKIEFSILSGFFPHHNLYRLIFQSFVLREYPPEEGTPDFSFHQNDRKGCTLDYLDGLGHFLFGFGATGKNYRVLPR